MKTNRFQSRQRRQAFTLIEVLLALGLSALLMAAVYSALELYRQFTTAGRDDIERAQLARAILRKMELDLRAVVYRDPSLEAFDTPAAMEGGDPDGALGTQGVEPVVAFSSRSLGVFGDSGTLVLHISRPSRDQYDSPWTDGAHTFGQTSDLRSVSYFLAGRGGGGLQGAVELPGLARLEGDRLAMEFADMQADLDMLAAETQLLAEEVNFLQFRYFDGFNWLDMWDTFGMGRLPSAVEITIGLSSSDVGDYAAFGGGRFDALEDSEIWRLVVALPLADPYALPLHGGF